MNLGSLTVLARAAIGIKSARDRRFGMNHNSLPDLIANDTNRLV